MNMSLIYGIVSVVSLLLAIGYCCFVRKKDIWLFLLHISVFVVNLGYFSLSISKTLEEALLANRISYLGSVFLPLCMLMTIFDVSKLKIPKYIAGILVSVSILIFLIAASPGYSDLYYKEVELVFINGVSKLDKVYGELHPVYYVYLFSCFALMTGGVLYSSVKKKITSYKYSAMLASVVFLNIIIWLVEQFMYTEFEFLSISYIASELILLFLFSIIQELSEQEKNPDARLQNSSTDYTEGQADTVCEPDRPESVSEEAHITSAKEQSSEESEKTDVILKNWQTAEPLTSREKEILRLMLHGAKRKDIAQELFLSENTVKTHSSHIFAKLGVAGKKELVEKAEELFRQL